MCNLCISAYSHLFIIVNRCLFWLTNLVTYHPKTYELLNKLLSATTWLEIFTHASVTTSVEASQIRHGYSITQGAKALILRTNGNLLMVVVPGDKKFLNSKLKSLLHVKEVSFATQEEIADLTDGILIGGVPPFGSAFNLKTYLDKSVLENDKIIFNCGDRQVSVAMYSQEYVIFEYPEICDLT